MTLILLQLLIMKKLTLFLLFVYSVSVFGQTETLVSFGSDSIMLAGTLSIPEGSGPHPAVVLVSGSGPQNRDGQILGFKPFKILADSLSKVGIAVLRYDDRGTGESTGKSVGMSTSDELAEDALNAATYLKNHKDIDPKKIGVIGHSEGGIIAPKVAVNDPDIAFIVLMAGFGVKGIELSNAQSAAIMRANGMDEGFITRSNKMNGKVLEMMSTPNLRVDSLESFIVRETIALIEFMPEAYKKSIANPEAYARQQAKTAIAQFKSPWIQYYMTYDPAPTLSKVSCPVLMLFGALDTQVLASQNQRIMEKVLMGAGNKTVTSKVFDKSNHLFQEARTGSPSEYAFLKPEFDSEFLPFLKSWLTQQLQLDQD